MTMMKVGVNVVHNARRASFVGESVSDKPTEIRGNLSGRVLLFDGGDLFVTRDLGLDKGEKSRGRKGRKFVFDAVEFGGIEGVDVAEE
jgi:hypothetical protein